MKVFLLSDIASEHTQKWALGLAASGIEVFIFSLNSTATNWHKGVANIKVMYEAADALNGKSLIEKINMKNLIKELSIHLKNSQIRLN